MLLMDPLIVMLYGTVYCHDYNKNMINNNETAFIYML